VRVLAACLLVALIFVLPARAQGGSKTVHVLVVIPATYSSTVTPDQAVSAVQSWLGQPTDAPCIGSQYTCTIEGWFRHELGQVFNYDLRTVSVSFNWSSFDACGSFSGPYLYLAVDPAVSAATGINFGNTSDRTMELVMGGGGWAGHYSPADRGRVVDHMGMVGDWGVEQQYGVPVSCIPAPDAPAHGFSHEFAGMMGEYVTAGYNEGGLFLGDVMSAHEKADLMHYSGQWLRAP